MFAVDLMSASDLTQLIYDLYTVFLLVGLVGGFGRLAINFLFNI